MTTVTLSPGEPLIILFAETDGEFHIHFDTEKYPNSVVVEEVAGLQGSVCGAANSVIYHDALLGVTDDAEVDDVIEGVVEVDEEDEVDNKHRQGLTDVELPYPGHAANVARIDMKHVTRTVLAKQVFTWPMNDHEAARKFLNTFDDWQGTRLMETRNCYSDGTGISFYVMDHLLSLMSMSIRRVLGDAFISSNHNVNSFTWPIAPGCKLTLTSTRRASQRSFVELHLTDPKFDTERVRQHELNVMSINLGGRTDETRAVQCAFSFPLTVASVRHMLLTCLAIDATKAVCIISNPTSVVLGLEPAAMSFACHSLSINFGNYFTSDSQKVWSLVDGCQIVVDEMRNTIALRVPKELADADDAEVDN